MWGVLREAGWTGVQREVRVAVLIQVAKGGFSENTSKT